MAGQGTACYVAARSGMARHGMAGKAGRGEVRLGWAWQGEAGVVRHGSARRVYARQAWCFKARHGKLGLGMVFIAEA